MGKSTYNQIKQLKDENKATVDSISKYTTDMILVIVGNYYGQSDLLKGSVQQIKFVLVPRAVNEKMVKISNKSRPPTISIQFQSIHPDGTKS